MHVGYSNLKLSFSPVPRLAVKGKARSRYCQDAIRLWETHLAGLLKVC